MSIISISVVNSSGYTNTYSDLISCRTANDKFQLKHRPRRLPAGYSEAIAISEANPLDEWKLLYSKEICGVLRALVNGLDDALYDKSSILGLPNQVYWVN